jgi:hypothetical protein
MQSRIGLIYLLILTVLLCWLSFPTPPYTVSRWCICFVAALTFPFLAHRKLPATRWWKESLRLLSIVVAAEICGLCTYFLWFGRYQYTRLGSFAGAISVSRENFGESVAFWAALDLIPAVCCAVVGLSIAYALFSLLTLVRRGG